MSKTKAQLENELAEARHLLAEAQKSRSTETAADAAPPIWLQQFNCPVRESKANAAASLPVDLIPWSRILNYQ